jgi:hypothetical protein
MLFDQRDGPASGRPANVEGCPLSAAIGGGRLVLSTLDESGNGTLVIVPVG